MLNSKVEESHLLPYELALNLQAWTADSKSNDLKARLFLCRSSFKLKQKIRGTILMPWQK